LSKSFDHKKYLEYSKTGTLFRKQAQISLSPKHAWVTRREKHTKTLESNNYAGNLPWKVFIAPLHHKDIENDQTIFSARHSAKREVCSESMTKYSSIQFLYDTRLYRGNTILAILHSKLKTNY